MTFYVSPTDCVFLIKTKEMIVDNRKNKTVHAPILIDGAVVEQAESFKFLVSTSPTQ